MLLTEFLSHSADTERNQRYPLLSTSTCSGVSGAVSRRMFVYEGGCGILEDEIELVSGGRRTSIRVRPGLVHRSAGLERPAAGVLWWILIRVYIGSDGETMPI